MAPAVAPAGEELDFTELHNLRLDRPAQIRVLQALEAKALAGEPRRSLRLLPILDLALMSTLPLLVQ